MYRRGLTRPADAELRERLKELSSERRRFGYRRLHLLLGREGWKVNWKKLYRIYREEGLSVRKRGGRKRAGRVIEEGTATAELLRIVD